MSINSLRMAKINRTKRKTDREKSQERKTLEGVLINSHKDKNKSYSSNNDSSQNSLNKINKETSFNMKKTLAPLVVGTVAAFGGICAISGIIKHSAGKILSSKPQECLPDLALNMNIKQEPHFAMYRMLRDPSTKNVLGFGAVMLFSAMTVVAKSFVDGIKKVWIKNREADIQRDLQENLISVETDSFSGKLNIVKEKTNEANSCFKEIFDKKEKDELKFKGKDNIKKEKDNKKKSNWLYGIVGLGVLGFCALTGINTAKNIRKTTKIANDFANDYTEKTINLIKSLSDGGKKENLERVKILLQSIYAKDSFIEETLKKFNLSDDEIKTATKNITAEAKSIFSDAPTALGGIPQKIQYYCYLDEERGHLYNWVLNPDNKFTKYIFLSFSAITSISYLGKQLVDAIQNVLVQKENSNVELNLSKKLVDVEVANFKSKKDSAINPMLEEFKTASKSGATKEELESMADNILFEIKNGPPYVYS